MNLTGAKINFLGDSITEGHGTSDLSKRFTDLIAARYGAICRNYGIGGTRIARQTKPSDVAAWDRDYPSRVAEMDKDADAVVVFGGTNDFGHSDAPFGTPADRAVGTFYGALHVLFAGLLEKYPAARIVVLTPTHRLNEDSLRGDNKPADVAPLIDYVRAIREVAEYYALPVLDLFAASGLQPKVDVLRETYMPDGLHPNDAGHERLARLIADYLLAH